MPNESAKSIAVEQRFGLAGLAMLISLGWLGTNLALAIGELPLKYVLKDELHLDTTTLARFLFLGQFTNYIKPVAGILTDSIPLFGTRRRYYLLISLTFAGFGYILLGLVPRTQSAMLITFALMYSMVVFTSTTLGGVMVEIGNRYKAEGRLTAQRIGMFKLGIVLGAPIAGKLAHYPFILAASVAGTLHLMLVPLFFFLMPEPRTSVANHEALRTAQAQLVSLVQNKVLLWAGLMIFLIAAAPGYLTPLFFHQSNVLHFDKTYVGVLLLVKNGFGLISAAIYFGLCRKVPLVKLTVISILSHAIGTLFFLGYRDTASAFWITAVEGMTSTLAMLPVYDFAARATPKGSEALGYSVMMSVWNLTTALSDWTGSWFFDHFNRNFIDLVWLNSGTTLIALVVIPFLPKALLKSRDGDKPDDQSV